MFKNSVFMLSLLFDTQEPLLPAAYDAANKKLKSQTKREKVPSQEKAALDHHVQGLMDHVGMVWFIFCPSPKIRLICKDT